MRLKHIVLQCPTWVQKAHRQLRKGWKRSQRRWDRIPSSWAGDVARSRCWWRLFQSRFRKPMCQLLIYFSEYWIKSTDGRLIFPELSATKTQVGTYGMTILSFHIISRLVEITDSWNVILSRLSKILAPVRDDDGRVPNRFSVATISQLTTYQTRAAPEVAL